MEGSITFHHLLLPPAVLEDATQIQLPKLKSSSYGLSTMPQAIADKPSLSIHTDADLEEAEVSFGALFSFFSLRLPLPWYKKVPLSLALSPRIISEVANFKPDIIHASSPGIMVFGALIIAKLLSVPIVMSYHTHVPIYTFSWLVAPMWMVIKFLHRAADLTLVPSAAIGRDLEEAQVTAANKIRLWKKGVDSESFHPSFRNFEMRSRLSNGEPEKPLIIHVGRLGVEKSFDFHKKQELEEMFSGMPAVFTGVLQGRGGHGTGWDEICPSLSHPVHTGSGRDGMGKTSSRPRPIPNGFGTGRDQRAKCRFCSS